MAGGGRFRPRARITGEQRASAGRWLRARYEKGASIRALAEAEGRSYAWVHAVLKEAGTQLRGRGGYRPR